MTTAATHVTVAYSDSADAYRVETYAAGDPTPVDVIDVDGGTEQDARTQASRLASDGGLTFFEWTGQAPASE
jgi:hypothetical protein